METKHIDVNGQVFRCPVEWTVEEAESRIRSRYVLQGGGIEENGVPVLGTARIRDLAGPLTFVGGAPVGGGSTGYEIAQLVEAVEIQVVRAERASSGSSVGSVSATGAEDAYVLTTRLRTPAEREQYRQQRSTRNETL